MNKLKVTTLIWILVGIGLTLAAIFGYFAHRWPNSNDLWVQLSIESGVLAISLFLINLIVDKYVKNERRNKWKPVRTVMVSELRRNTISILHHVDLYYACEYETNERGVTSVVRFKTNEVETIDEFDKLVTEAAKRISKDGLSYVWNDGRRTLPMLMDNLREKVSKLVSAADLSSFALDEETELFQKILAVKHAMDDLYNIYFSYVSIGENGFDHKIYKQDQSDNINTFVSSLLAASLDLFAELEKVKVSS